MDQVKRFEFSRQKLLRWCDLLFHTIKNGKKVLQKSAVEWSKFWQIKSEKTNFDIKWSLYSLWWISWWVWNLDDQNADNHRKLHFPFCVQEVRWTVDVFKRPLAIINTSRMEVLKHKPIDWHFSKNQKKS